MTGDVVGVIRAIVRDLLRSFRTAELAVVETAYPHASASDRNNYECDVRLRDSGLVLRRVPVGVQRIGAAAIPNAGDLVLVQFLGGDLHTAIITARLYNDQDRPPEAAEREFVYASRDEPESGVRRAYLEFPQGHKLTLDDEALFIEMGQTTLRISHDGDVELTSAAKVVVQAKGDTQIEAQGNLDLKAQGDVALEGANVMVKARSSATLEGGSSATLKGSSVSIAGTTQFSAG